MDMRSLPTLGDHGATPSADERASVWPLHRLDDPMFGDRRVGLPAPLRGGIVPRMNVVEKGSRTSTACSHGVSARSPGLPSCIEAEGIAASLDEGGLTVRFPKDAMTSLAPQRIAIRAP
ncbi:Hsp20/alpha crystallin family protein [Methylobacterium goesingense]|uniref:Hsp20/alpha crystallin family protein n=1 Tax=Methylobacterium goesingense TaxID=243690 RepID=A0ABV2LA79_9HYPH|nr:hypothetical protein [Methylobacterium goesingense]GJD74272.1 hypothetical protein CFIICLFH_2506 [Methylobacterium goesingense]